MRSRALVPWSANGARLIYSTVPGRPDGIRWGLLSIAAAMNCTLPRGGQDRIDVFAFNGGQPATPVPVPSLLLPGLVVGLIALAGWRLRRRSPRA